MSRYRQLLVRLPCPGLHAGAVAGLRVVLASACLATPAVAQTTELRPGLWEHRLTVKSDSGRTEGAMADMRRRIEAMPPAERAQLDAAMAAQGTVLGPEPNTFRVCMTPEQAARGDVPPPNGRCSQQILERSAKRLKLSFACTGESADSPPAKGEGEVEFSSPTAYLGRTTIDTMTQGKPDRVEMEQAARWVAADCGPVRPAAP